jgi:hypothetical protein
MWFLCVVCAFKIYILDFIYNFHIDLSDIKIESLRTDVGKYPPELWQTLVEIIRTLKPQDTKMTISRIP